MPRGSGYGLGTSPILAIASGLAGGQLQNRESDRAAAAAAEKVLGPQRERRRLQELARTQLGTLDPTLADEQFDETRDYAADLEERRQIRRRAQAYRTVNPSVSLEEAEALMVAGPNAKPPRPRRQYDAARGVVVDPDAGTFEPIPNLPPRPTPPVRPPNRAPRIITTDQGVFALDEETNTLTPVKAPDGTTAQPKPTGGRGSTDVLREILGGLENAGQPSPLPDALQGRPPLTEAQKARAQRDPRYRQFLMDMKGYTAADFVPAPAAAVP